jgi:hypothetical protein
MISWGESQGLRSWPDCRLAWRGWVCGFVIAPAK